MGFIPDLIFALELALNEESSREVTPVSYGNKTLRFAPATPAKKNRIEQRNGKVPHALSFSGRKLRHCVRLLYLHCGLTCKVNIK